MKKPVRPKAPVRGKTAGHANPGGPAVAAKRGPAKPAAGKATPKAKPVSAKVKAARHTAALKSAKTRAANAKKHPRRQLALGEGVACCSAEALAASLRLTGRTVGNEDVLALYWRTASDPEAGASILDTLRAAWEFGLAGVRPVWFGPAEASRDPLGRTGEGWGRLIEPGEGGSDVLCEPAFPFFGDGHALILGLELPGPHAVLAETGRWWSWGEPHDPATWPDAVIEEAWTVQWQTS